MQYRSPVGRGPSSKTWPRCPLQRAQWTSVRSIPRVRSVVVSTASGHRRPEARPSGSAVELRLRREELLSAARAAEDPFAVFRVQTDSFPRARFHACAGPEIVRASTSRAIPRRSLECPSRQSTRFDRLRRSEIRARRTPGVSVGRCDRVEPAAEDDLFSIRCVYPNPTLLDLKAPNAVSFSTADGLTLNGWFVSRTADSGIHGHRVQRQRWESRVPRPACRRARGDRISRCFFSTIADLEAIPVLRPRRDWSVMHGRRAITSSSRPDVDRRRLVYFGESLGTAVATDFGGRIPAGGADSAVAVHVDDRRRPVTTTRFCRCAGCCAIGMRRSSASRA